MPGFKRKHLSALALLGALAIQPLWAADLKIALSADVSSLDPHYLNIAPNVAFSSHIFDAVSYTHLTLPTKA